MRNGITVVGIQLQQRDECEGSPVYRRMRDDKRRIIERNNLTSEKENIDVECAGAFGNLGFTVPAVIRFNVLERFKQRCGTSCIVSRYNHVVKIILIKVILRFCNIDGGGSNIAQK